MPEYFDVLDENGQKTGQTKLRELVHRDGDWHRAVLIWVVNSAGEILLQRRCPTKDSHPNMLDVSGGGHLSAGDDALTGAVREVGEELGLKIQPEDLTHIGSFKYCTRPAPDFINNSFFDIFLLRTDKTIDEMTPQEEEISEIFFVPYAEFKKMVARRDPELVWNPYSFNALFRKLDPDFSVTSYKIIATDFDGTLLNSNKEISERNRLALETARALGFTIVGATGRYLSAIRDYYDANLFDYVTLNNGAAIYDVANDKLIDMPSIPMEYLRSITDHFKDSVDSLDFFSTDTHYILGESRQAKLHWVRISDLAEIKGSIVRINIFLSLADIETAKQYLDATYPDLNTIIMSDTDIRPDLRWLGINRKDTNKMSSLRYLCDMLSLSTNDVIFFGDSANDLPVFGNVGKSVAMGNALPEIKAMADDVALSNDEDGLAVFLENFLSTL